MNFCISVTFLQTLSSVFEASPRSLSSIHSVPGEVSSPFYRSVCASRVLGLQLLSSAFDKTRIEKTIVCLFSQGVFPIHTDFFSDSSHRLWNLCL